MQKLLLSLSCSLLFLAGSLSGCGRTTLIDGGDASVRPDGTLPDGGVCTSDSQCDDGVFCNGTETCGGGECQRGSNVTCDDGVSCTNDVCSEAGRTCEFIPDGSLCPSGQLCDVEAGCEVVPCDDDEDCSDTFFCNGNEFCGRGGFCLAGEPLFCDDGVDCTNDACSEAIRDCVTVPNDALCDDGAFCNGTEVCGSRGCASGRPVNCDDRDECTLDRCDDGSGSCQYVRSGDPECVEEGCPDVDLGTRTGAGVARGTTTGSLNRHEGTCGGDSASDQAFAWTAPRSGTYTITTFGSTFDTLLHAKVSCDGRELPGACDDDTDGLQSLVTVSVRAGERIIIVVDGFGSSDGNFVLNISEGGIETDCFNRRDDDGDGLVDCEDPDCARFPECGVMCDPFETSCGDEIDNDCDGDFDCRDTDCIMSPECGMCVPTEPAEFSCADGIDNDCNGFFDCDDFNCRFAPGCDMCVPTSRVERNCTDRIDNDCNGLTDCADDSCSRSPACDICVPVFRFERRCADGQDDDCDGDTDCEDRDCAGRPICSMCVPTSRIEINCGNGTDDDCDGAFDCADPDCRFSPGCSVDAGPPDVVDPDGSMCTAREIGIAGCTDRVDNDCDLSVDCADPDCSPFGAGSECCDGIDNDGDGQTDLFTCRCESDAECAGVGSLEQVCWSTLFSVCAPRCNFLGGTLWCRSLDPSLVCNSGSGECVPGPTP